MSEGAVVVGIWVAAAALSSVAGPSLRVAAMRVLGAAATAVCLSGAPAAWAAVETGSPDGAATAFGWWVRFLVALVGWIVALRSPDYVQARFPEPSLQRRHDVLINLFLAAMSLTTVTSDRFLLWSAVEATTLASVFLVALGSGSREVEAAWKYFVVTGVGALLALFGTAVAVSLPSAAPVERLAPLLIVLGYGVKAGLFPGHTWLPDAHSVAPASASALLSGVELNCALYAIFRSLAEGGSVPYGVPLLAIIGLASLFTASLLMLMQTNVKRVLALSSIGHMGTAALGLAAGGPVGVAGALFTMTAHAITKSFLFLTAGEAEVEREVHDVEGLRALRKTAPGLAWGLALGSLALAGLPPSLAFVGDVAVVGAAFGTFGWAAGIACVLGLALQFAGLARALVAPALAEQADGAPHEPSRRAVRVGWRGAVAVAQLLLAAALGVWLPPELVVLLSRIGQG